MDQLALSVERPVLLSTTARSKLESARKRLREEEETDQDGGKTASDKDRMEILERAHEDALNNFRPDNLPLSTRLRKLWAERGDFSRFKVSTLITSGETDVEDSETSKNDYDLGANLQGLVEGEDGKEAGNTKENEEGELGSLSTEEGKVIMSIQDMLELRTKMMERLGIAQNALYFSHALVSLLINSSKADVSTTSNPSAVRAGSPTSNSAGGAAIAAARGDTAASTSAMQRNTNPSRIMGSAANLEAELGIESNVFGASRLEAERREVEPREGNIGAEAQDNGDDEDNDDDEVENLEVELKKQRKYDRKLNEMEREERARELVDCFQGKKQSINQAAEILRGGARALRGIKQRNEQEKMRWQVLLEARRTGWNLTPDKPVRGTANNKRELLEDGNRRKDEPARDAWIGYAAPEAHSQYQRRAMAYFNHDVVASSDSPTQRLAFASRTRKHLRVRFTIGSEIWSSEDTVKVNTASIDGQLRQAQLELADAEIFDAILSECRGMTTLPLFATNIDNEDSISVSLNGVELLLEMVEAEKLTLSDDSNSHSSSAMATAAVSLLRLGLLRYYRVRDDVEGQNGRISSTKIGDADRLHIPLLLPLLGPIHYASFLIHLKGVLERVRKKDSRKTYQLQGLEKLQNTRHWLAMLLQGSHDSSSAEAMGSLGGSATMYIDEQPVAFLVISYPSNLSLSLPMKRNTLGERGISIGRCNVQALESILSEDLQ